MNTKQIEILEDQASLYASRQTTDLDEWEFIFRKKFAELIVRECAEICLEANDHKNILRHFGVEESGINQQLRNRSTYFGNNP